MGAADGGGVAPGLGYVAALCPPAAASIQQVKVPVGRGGVYTRSPVPEHDGDGGGPEAAAIWEQKQQETVGSMCAQTPAARTRMPQTSVGHLLQLEEEVDSNLQPDHILTPFRHLFMCV